MVERKRDRTTVILKAIKPREKIVAELWCGEYLLGELVREDNMFTLDIFTHPAGEMWSLELEDFLHLLNDARQQLIQAE